MKVQPERVTRGRGKVKGGGREGRFRARLPGNQKDEYELAKQRIGWD